MHYSCLNRAMTISETANSYLTNFLSFEKSQKASVWERGLSSNSLICFHFNLKCFQTNRVDTFVASRTLVTYIIYCLSKHCSSFRDAHTNLMLLTTYPEVVAERHWVIRLICLIFGKNVPMKMRALQGLENFPMKCT